MSTDDWKNHPFEKLHETGNPSLLVTLSSFVVWKDGVICSTGAVGAKHIIKLIKWAMELQGSGLDPPVNSAKGTTSTHLCNLKAPWYPGQGLSLTLVPTTEITVTNGGTQARGTWVGTKGVPSVAWEMKAAVAKGMFFYFSATYTALGAPEA
eukprot:285059-Rhodomonas_salina.1